MNPKVGFQATGRIKGEKKRKEIVLYNWVVHEKTHHRVFHPLVEVTHLILDGLLHFFIIFLKSWAKFQIRIIWVPKFHIRFYFGTFQFHSLAGGTNLIFGDLQNFFIISFDPRAKFHIQNSLQNCKSMILTKSSYGVFTKVP